MQCCPKKHILPYSIVIVALGITGLVSHFADLYYRFFHTSHDYQMIASFFVISIIFVLSFFIFHVSTKTVIPSFVTAIFFGMVAKPFFAPIVEDQHMLAVIVGLGATLILFSGGLETPFAHFKKILAPIISLSFVGLFITALCMSCIVYVVASIGGIPVSIETALLLGAIVASTDPAAIIPVVKNLRFKNRQTKDIIISESAVTDVTGTLLTIAFLSLIVSGVSFSSLIGGYATLFDTSVVFLFLRQTIFGIIFGIAGYLLLVLLTKFQEKKAQEDDADIAFFLFVPIMIFAFALAFGGSGYLAAFLAGLFFTLSKHLHRSEVYTNQTIEGFFKPTIFVLLGALVDINVLVSYAGIGIICAIIFMGVIRPLAVGISLFPFYTFTKRFSFKELLFISFVRETGAIPAVLLVTVVSSGIPGLEGLVPIGMWIILLTLIIEPPLTPYIATKLGVADVITDHHALHITHQDEPFVVLGSRGHSYAKRLPFVVDWATKHGIKRVVLLYCLEDEFSKEKEDFVGQDAEREFVNINDEREKEGLEPIIFSAVSRQGFLQTNIDALSKEQEHVSAIFVGRKMLDFRLDEIKNLRVPLYFID